MIDSCSYKQSTLLPRARAALAANRRFGAAEQRLARAIRMAPDRRADWAPALEDARFYGRLAEARALNEQQNYDQALQAVIPLARAGGRRGRDAAQSHVNASLVG